MLRQTLGALLYDGVPFELRMWGIGAREMKPEPWLQIRNRDETIAMDEQGVECNWRFTSELHIGKVFPSTAVRLLRKALRRWPISFADALRKSEAPEVTFLIGHRGRSRLPQLLLTLRSIAAQRDAAIECIVVEQAHVAEVRSELPAWVRYIHQPADEGAPYNRSRTFNTGAAASRGRLLVLHDNDMLVPERYAAELAVHAAAGWEAIDLKRFIFYLTEQETGRVLRHQRLHQNERSEVVIQNLHGGSVAITRDGYEAIGGLDEDFVGWGGEDNEFWERAETLRSTRFGYLPIVHLWHAPQSEKLQASDAPAVKRYRNLGEVSPQERIARLRASSGLVD